MYYLMILYNNDSIFTSNSETHLMKPDIFLAKNAVIATATIYGNVN